MTCLVELVDRVLQLEDEAHEFVEVLVGVRVLVALVVVDARGRHERRADRLDLLDVAELFAVEDLVKVGDELVEHAQELTTALEGLVVLCRTARSSSVDRSLICWLNFWPLGAWLVVGRFFRSIRIITG